MACPAPAYRWAQHPPVNGESKSRAAGSGPARRPPARWPSAPAPAPAASSLRPAPPGRPPPAPCRPAAPAPRRPCGARCPACPGTPASSPISSFSTRRSARAPIRWISPVSSSTRPSVISACRLQHSAASSAYRTGTAHSAKPEGNIRAARARHAATIRSEASANRSGAAPPRTLCSACRPPPAACPAQRPRISFQRRELAVLPSQLLQPGARPRPSRVATPTAKASSDCRSAEATTRSTWLSAGGSISSLRHRCRSAATSRRPAVFTGQTSPPATRPTAPHQPHWPGACRTPSGSAPGGT